MLSVYGKLPIAGDFLTIEVPKALLRPIEDWLARGTAAARDACTGDWNTVFDAGGAWYFWIGEQVLGRRMAGVMRPSRDKVGRRFPVMLFASSEDLDAMPDAPVLEEGQELYDGLADELDYLATQTPDAIAERLRAAAGPGEAPASPQNGFFWAVAAEPGAEGWDKMIAETREADHAAASARRSYWWQPPEAGQPAAMLATEGMPAASNFVWFVTGVSGAGLTNAQETA